jgi:hypothetical protein
LELTQSAEDSPEDNRYVQVHFEGPWLRLPDVEFSDLIVIGRQYE